MKLQLKDISRARGACREERFELKEISAIRAKELGWSIVRYIKYIRRGTDYER